MTTNRTLRAVILSGIFLLPFIVLIVSDHLFFPFITGKNFTFRVIVEIIFACWLILALRDRQYLPKVTWILKCLGIFLAVMLVSDLLSPNAFKSFWSNYERMEGYVTLLHLAALFLVTSSVLTKKLWERLFQTSVGVSVIVFFYGALQLMGKLAIHQSGTRIDTTLGNATYVAVYMLFHIFLTALLIAWWKGPSWVRYLYGLIIVGQLFTLYHTATRGATIGVLGGFFLTAVLVAFFDREGQHKVARKFSIGIITAVIVIVAGFYLVKDKPFVNTSPVLQRFSSLSFTDKTAESRFMIWNMAWQGFKERPIFGWGQESFNYIFNKYYNPAMYSQEQWFDRTHNVFFDWLVAGGLLGILSYLSLFAFAIYYLWRKDGPFDLIEKSLFTGLFAGYFFHNLTVFDNISSYLMFIFVLAYIDASAGKESSALAERVGKIDEGTVNRILAPLVVVLTIICIYFVNVPGLLASYDLIQALSYQGGNYSMNLSYFEKALAHHSFGDSEIREQLSQTASQVMTSGLDETTKAGYFDLTKKELLRQLDRTPDDARYQVFTGAFLDRAGRYDEALPYLKRASELSPNKQTILFELGTSYLSAKDPKDALATLKRAVELDPSFTEAKKMYAIIAIYAGDNALVTSIFKDLDPKVILGDERFTAAFIATGHPNEAVESLSYLIQNNPENTGYYKTLAGIYLQANRSDVAIAVLNKAVAANPSFKEEADTYIKQIKSGKK